MVHRYYVPTSWESLNIQGFDLLFRDSVFIRTSALRLLGRFTGCLAQTTWKIYQNLDEILTKYDAIVTYLEV